MTGHGLYFLGLYVAEYIVLEEPWPAKELIFGAG